MLHTAAPAKQKLAAIAATGSTPVFGATGVVSTSGVVSTLGVVAGTVYLTIPTGEKLLNVAVTVPLPAVALSTSYAVALV